MRMVLTRHRSLVKVLVSPFTPGFDFSVIALHDTQIAPSLINRDAAAGDVLVGDKGYDDQQIRATARANAEYLYSVG